MHRLQVFLIMNNTERFQGQSCTFLVQLSPFALQLAGQSLQLQCSTFAASRQAENLFLP